MNSKDDIIECCGYIESSKVNERKKYCNNLSNFLEKKEVIDFINTGDSVTWKKILASVQECLRKDADKSSEDVKKKGTSNFNGSAAELFVQVVKIATQGVSKIDISSLVGYIIGSMKESKMKMCYKDIFLCVIHKYVLTNSKCRDSLDKDDWEGLYLFLKKTLEESNSDTIYKSLVLLLKWGPSSGLQAILLREDFAFITRLCQNVSLQTSKPQQEDILEIAINFCKHTAKDNKVSCCKFGEDVASNFIDLYEQNGRNSKTKELIVEFFLLQMILHHPNGVYRDHPCAFASNWTNWEKTMKIVYSRLIQELHFYFKYHLKNSSFFINKGETKMLEERFLLLFIELSRQLFSCPDIDVSLSLDCTLASQGAQKRQKVEVTMRNYINNIKESKKNWLWVYIIRNIVDIYPDLIDVVDYVKLLQILSTIQIESNDFNVIHNIYICFSTLLDKQHLMDTNFVETNVNKLWNMIGETTTRNFGIKQHKEVIETLLHKMLQNKLLKFDAILQLYSSRVLNISLQSIHVLEVGLKSINLGKADIHKREKLINSILNVSNCQDCEYLLHKKTARLLVKLILQQWPDSNETKKTIRKISDGYSDIIDIHFKTLLEKEILLPEVENDKDCDLAKSYNIDSDVAQILIDALENFITKDATSIKMIFTTIVLLLNILDEFMLYKLTEEMDINDLNIYKFIEFLLKKDVLRNFEVFRDQSEREGGTLIKYLNILDVMFNLDVSCVITTKIKNLFPVSILRKLGDISNNLDPELTRESQWKFQIKKSIIKVLSSYCCKCGDGLNKTQNDILEVMAQPDYNYALDEDYELLVTFLRALKHLRPGIMCQTIMDKVRNSLQDMCIARYLYTENVIEILNIFHDLYPHFAIAPDEDNKITVVALLKPFYDTLANYGPEVALGLLKCLQQLCKVDPEFNFARWLDVEVIKYVPEFLCSNHQEVRLKAVETLVIFFQTTPKSKQLRHFHRQEEVFAKSFEKSIAVFNISGELTEEGKIDETLSRTASVLHTFGSIIVNCNCWIAEGLFALIKLSHLKNITSVEKILNLIKTHMLTKQPNDVMETYLEYFIENWMNENFSFEEFPFQLFGCDNKNSFYLKYFDICIPFFIVKDSRDMLQTGSCLELTKMDIVQRSAAKIFSRVIINTETLDENLFRKNDILKDYIDTVGFDYLKSILITNLEQIMLNVMDFLTDERYILEYFNETVVFPKTNLSVCQLKSCLNFIQVFLCNSQNVVKFLIQSGLHKIEKMLLSLKLNIYKVFTVNDKLKMLHRYTYFIDIITDIMDISSIWQYFFIRDTTYTLINLINNHKNSKLIMAVARYLLLWMKKILPDFSDTFGPFLVFVINSLKSVYITTKGIRQTCIEIMEFVVVEHSPSFLHFIEKLDNFPHDSEFQNIRNVHERVKFNNSQPELEQEIKFFLLHADRTDRLDSLIHLKKVLSQEKNKVKDLYNKLQEVRGFSEDCEKSLLHRLVSTLAKISCYDDQEVSFAASKCLGEIGPANLTTLVLQPERAVLNLKCSPLELLSGHVIALLVQYIVDQNIQVSKIASETLYIVLGSKEGRKVGESNIDFGFGPISKQDLLPYFSLTKSSSSVIVDVNNFISRIDQTELWCHPTIDISHERWITRLICAILNTFSYRSYLEKLIPICEVKTKFCESLLPHIINLLLHLNKPEITQVLSENINHFFVTHWKNTVPKIQNEESITLNKKSVRCMLQVINFVRMQRHFNESSSKNIDELNIDYLKVAKASEFCASHFSALFYSELWCQSKIKEMQDENENISEQRSSMIDGIYERQGEEVGEALQNILRNAYKAIGDLDALPGCGTYFLLKPQSRVEHYKEHGKWDQVTHFYSEQLFQGTSQAKNELMESFKKSGLYHIPLLCSKEVEERQYECLWRLSQWDTTDNRRISCDNTLNLESFEKYRFYSLKSLHENNMFSFKDGHKWQNICLVENLKHRSFESSHNLYPILAHLQSLVEMEDFAEACTTEGFLTLLKKWELQDTLIKGSDFQYIDSIITQRLVMLTDYLKKQNHGAIKNYVINLTLNFAALAKDEGFFKEGLTILNNLKYLSDLSEDLNTRIQLMDAQLSWLMDDKLLARHSLNTICKKPEVNPKLKSMALKMLGQYMSETYTENRLVIISDYFLKSISILSDLRRNEEDSYSIMDTYDKLARFADREYQQISTYMKSDLFQRKVANMEKARQTASTIKKQHKKTLDESRAATIHDRNSNIDENEIISAKQESNNLLRIALKYYLLNLNLSLTSNIRIFRIISLFLENRNNSFIADIVDTYMQKISSYKYITVLPQLIPHITDSNTDLFSGKVNEIVEKCATDHPHHTLPLLLALANANKDREFSDQKTNTSQNDNRMATAKKLLENLKKKGLLSEHINKLQQLSSALIDLAYYQDPQHNPRQHEFNIPRNQKISKIRNFDNVLLPTYNLKVNPSCNYSNIVGIVSFDNVYRPVGGINAPKRIACLGTDGIKRSQLIKGHDDLRQDAVMQQVFTIMNDLLLGNKETRNLFIRTYKIVPLSMRSGILEWVDNSTPIGNYLVGADKVIGAHQKFRPKDKLPSYCRDIFKRAATQSAEEKLNTYKQICHKFKPVFHKFFESYFPQATVWYERRRAYIHSVATTSMCGYILGIGDRHVSNILVDTNTAEVIHIDFGIAFEQGRVLPTPETVPFRLTRDVVDGMGVSGVEGVFKRSCEKTMKVLRQNAQTIITILEVLLYDPLYAWTVTSAEASKRQTDEDVEYRASGSSEEEATVNITAERALLRLREKLQGTELGHPTSIEHQVGTLIQQAIDPANLCKLFHGWQPYL